MFRVSYWTVKALNHSTKEIRDLFSSHYEVAAYQAMRLLDDGMMVRFQKKAKHETLWVEACGRSETHGREMRQVRDGGG